MADSRDSFVIFKVTGIDSCEAAENYRNKAIFADMEVVERDDSDYSGYRVIVDGREVGSITEINNYGSKDIWSIEGENNIMLPYIDNLIESKDDEAKTITLNSEIFNQVAVYEN